MCSTYMCVCTCVLRWSQLYESGGGGGCDQPIFEDTLWMVPELLYMAAFAAHDDGKLSDVRASYYKKSGNSHALMCSLDICP